MTMDTTVKPPRFYTKWQDLNYAEGWILSAADLIERDDDRPEIFPDDRAALAFVERRARAGSARHEAALWYHNAAIADRTPRARAKRDTLSPEVQRYQAEQGLKCLRQALKHFKYSNNRQTADRVRLAISSAKGAVRICGYRCSRD